MKPPPFDYVLPATVDEAVSVLAEPGAVVLAGGQSLLLELAYRQHRPRLVVDLNAVPGLDALEEGDGALRIGALVRHRDLERVGVGATAVRRLLTTVAPWVAHPPIRTRGTFCGSVAWAHPAAEWNAVAVALDARVELRSVRGARTVAAVDWYLGDRRTARAADELVTAVALTALDPRSGTGFVEHRRTHASFADVAVVATVVVADGVAEQARLGVVGAADRPLRLDSVETALRGTGSGAVAGLGRQLASSCAELAGTGDDARTVAAVLVGRALEQAVASSAAATEEVGR